MCTHLAGFQSWNIGENHVDLEEELSTMTMQAPEGENARHGKWTFIACVQLKRST